MVCQADLWGDSSKYCYTHPRVQGIHQGLTSAKVAHLLDGQPHTTFPAASLEATYCHGRARWKDIASQGVAISQEFRDLFDVVLADTSDSGTATKVDKGDYNMHGLTSKHGYLSITKASLVLEGSTFLVLGVFVTALVAPQLTDMADPLALLYNTMKLHVPDCCNRPGLRMFGYRFCQYAKHLSQMGYYVCRDAWDLYNDREARAVVEGIGSSACALERLISPPMGLERMKHAEQSNHPGIWPGVPISKCSATALGISRGYSSWFHNDFGDQMSETITFDTRDVPNDSGYCFAIARGRVLFSLLHSGGAAMTMVQGTIMHGTPNLNPGVPKIHGGIGCVMVSKTNVLNEKRVAESKRFKDCLADPRFDSSCPFTTEFLNMMKKHK